MKIKHNWSQEGISYISLNIYFLAECFGNIFSEMWTRQTDTTTPPPPHHHQEREGKVLPIYGEPSWQVSKRKARKKNRETWSKPEITMGNVVRCQKGCLVITAGEVCSFQMTVMDTNLKHSYLGSLILLNHKWR